jgi:plasmid stabilization system protein ParE
VTRPIRFRPAAQAEYDEAADWYEAQQPGLGKRFIEAIETVMNEVAVAPERWPEVLANVRERPISRWPYCIYYKVSDNHIEVLAVFHASRDPKIWRSRATR